MAWGSTVPGAMAGLVAALKASAALAGVAVDDGSPATESAATQAIIVGYQDDATNPVGSEGTNAFEGMSVDRNREQYSVNCAALVLNGDGDLQAARDAAYVLLNAVGAALSADKTLGGAVMSAHIGAWNERQIESSRGAKLCVQFAVDCDAFSSA